MSPLYRVTTTSLATHLSGQTSRFDDPRAFDMYGLDNSFDLSDFKENFGIRILSLDEERVVFEMTGIEAPLANAFRRILLAEVLPTTMTSLTASTDSHHGHRKGV